MSLKKMFKDGVFAEIDRNRVQELDAKVQEACVPLYSPLMDFEDAVKKSVQKVKEVLDDHTKDEQAFLLCALSQSVVAVGLRGQIRVRRIRSLAVRSGVDPNSMPDLDEQIDDEDDEE